MQILEIIFKYIWKWFNLYVNINRNCYGSVWHEFVFIHFVGLWYDFDIRILKVKEINKNMTFYMLTND